MGRGTLLPPLQELHPRFGLGLNLWSFGLPIVLRASVCAGCNHGWKVEGDEVWVPTPLHPRAAKDRAGCWVREGVAPSRCEGPGVNFFENPAFWWLLAVKFLACWELWARSSGDQYMVGTPNLKVGGSVSPGPYGCCPYESAITCSYFRSLDKDGGHTIQSAIAKTLRCMQTSRLCVCYRMKSYIDNQSFTLRE